MELSVLIVTYGNPGLTRECLLSVKRETRELAAEVIVADNASPDETPTVIEEEFPEVRLIRLPENLGFARANNLAAAQASGEFLLLLNPDTVVHPGALRELLAFGRRRPAGGVYGGRTLDPAGELDPRSCWGAPSLWSTFCFATGLTTLFAGSALLNPESMGGWRRDSEREVGVVTGCLALIRRELWDELGGLDEAFFMYSEDTDLAIRVAKRGYRPCITPAATITHVAGASSGAKPAKTVALLRGKATVMIKHWSEPRARLGLALLQAGVGLRAAGERVSAWRRSDTRKSMAWTAAWRARRQWRRGYEPSAASRIHLVATPGGHLDLLLALRSSFERFDRVWVVSAGSVAESLQLQGEQVRIVPRFHGLSLRNLRLALRSVRPVLRERPQLIVTTGSGSSVPFCLIARLLGARIVFVETMARVTNASWAGQVLSRLASTVLVQWPEMQRVYRGAHVCRPVLLDAVVDGPGADPRRQGVGTFVAVGSHVDQFDRLLEMVDRAVGRGVLPSPAIAQTGVCRYRPQHMEARVWMLPEEMTDATDRAAYVVSHAGSGLIARTLNAGMIPIVLPRRHEFGEHVDDHQVQITEKLGSLGLAIPVDGEISPQHLEAADAAAPGSDLTAMNDLPRIQDLLEGEIASSGRDG